MVVRWGDPPAVEVAVAPGEPPGLAVLSERVRVLQELTHALAADVAGRDRRRGEELGRAMARIDELAGTTVRRLHDAERGLDALYAAHFKPPEGGLKQ
jgi:hypothetical protein